MTAFFAILVAVTLPSVLAAAQPVTWRVVNVHDGDTLTVLDPAKDIATTCPYYVAKSFKAVGHACGEWGR